MRFSIFTVAALSQLAAIGAEPGQAVGPSVTFDGAVTTALVTVLTALATWLGVRSHAERRAVEKVRVEQERQPPLGEDVARTYATKREVCELEGKLSSEVGQIRQQMDTNDKALRDLVEVNNTAAESRSRATHARIDSLYKAQNKTNRSLGILIGQLSVIARRPVKIDDDDTED